MNPALAREPRRSPSLPTTTRRGLVLGLALLAGAATVAQAARPAVVRYEDFGAVGDGQTDDLPAIVRAHDHANRHGLPVRARDDATYYLGGRNLTATIRTSTDFGRARFIIDDTQLENRGAHIFAIRSDHAPIRPELTRPPQRGHTRIDLSLPRPCVVVVTNDQVRQYIRKGSNANQGKSQTDVLVVDAQGRISPETPVLWDFSEVTQLVAYPIDDAPLIVRGGHFTTRANQAESKYHYHARGITIRRSKVQLQNLEHHVVDEGPHGAPYGGFIQVQHATRVTVSDTLLSGHKTYQTVGRTSKPVSMGSYDINCRLATHVAFVRCRQNPAITDRSRWGIMASNYCKNLLYDDCTLSRFDAHMGVFDATIRNSTIGYMGIRVIGFGTLRVENTTVRGSRSFVSLRSDYGSTWRGRWILRDCRYEPGSHRGPVVLFRGQNDGTHDFGYACFMPRDIFVDGLHIEDVANSKHAPAWFDDFGTPPPDPPHPYTRTQRLVVKNVTTASGRPLRRCTNPDKFETLVIE